ncbi:MAG: glutaredoxin domain-containing protein [Pseudomonadota bacterium]
MALQSQADEIRVFWQPGCSSCLRTKEFLAEHGVPFRSVDVLNDAGGMDEMAALGVRTVPIVARGADYVSGQILRDVAAFVGVGWGRNVLPVPELKARIDGILAGTLRFSAQLPEDCLDVLLPDRPRSYRDLACHIFQIVEAFVEEAEGDPLTAAKYEAPAPVRVRTVADILEFGHGVQARFDGWWVDADGANFTRAAHCYYGAQTQHDFMERTAWHAGQHARQLQLVLRKLDIAPDHPMTDADFAGLPMPENVWDNDKRWD